MSPFFALVFTCGYLTCDPPKEIIFPDEASCREFIQPFVLSHKENTGVGAACFDRTTGKVIVSSKQLAKEKKADERN